MATVIISLYSETASWFSVEPTAKANSVEVHVDDGDRGLISINFPDSLNLIGGE